MIDDLVSGHEMRVLCFGKTQSRLRQRCEVVGNAGHSADSASYFDEAIALASENVYDALIVGQSVPESERTELAQMMKLRNSKLLVIFLYENSIRGAEIADAVLNGLGDVNDIVRTLHFLEQRNNSGSANL